jgi:hypothetical protein
MKNTVSLIFSPTETIEVPKKYLPIKYGLIMLCPVKYLKEFHPEKVETYLQARAARDKGLNSIDDHCGKMIWT